MIGFKQLIIEEINNNKQVEELIYLFHCNPILLNSLEELWPGKLGKYWATVWNKKIEEKDLKIISTYFHSYNLDLQHFLNKKLLQTGLKEFNINYPNELDKAYYLAKEGNFTLLEEIVENKLQLESNETKKILSLLPRGDLTFFNKVINKSIEIEWDDYYWEGFMHTSSQEEIKDFIKLSPEDGPIYLLGEKALRLLFSKIKKQLNSDVYLINFDSALSLEGGLDKKLEEFKSVTDSYEKPELEILAKKWSRLKLEQELSAKKTTNKIKI